MSILISLATVVARCGAKGLPAMDVDDEGYAVARMMCPVCRCFAVAEWDCPRCSVRNCTTFGEPTSSGIGSLSVRRRATAAFDALPPQRFNGTTMPFDTACQSINQSIESAVDCGVVMFCVVVCVSLQACVAAVARTAHGSR